MSLLNETDLGQRRVGLPAWLARRAILDPRLLVVDGHATKQQIEIRLPMTIGREAGAGLVIAHPLVSRQHCVISRRDDFLYVKDNSAANGTFINGKKITESYLRPGDKLTVGPLTFVAVYQQSGPMSSRQLARKLANEVRRRKGLPTLPDAAPKPAPAGGPAAPKNDKPEVDETENFDLDSFLKEAAQLAKATVDGTTVNQSAEEPTTEEALDILQAGADEFGSDEEVDEQFCLFFNWAGQMAASAKRKAKREAAEKLQDGEQFSAAAPAGPKPDPGSSISSMNANKALSGLQVDPPPKREDAPKTPPKSAAAAALERLTKSEPTAPRRSPTAAEQETDDFISQDFFKAQQAAGNDALAGKTLLGSSIPRDSSMLDVTVKLEQKRMPKRPSNPPSVGSPPDQLERVGGYVLEQIVRLQTQVLEHYQEAVITSQLVARLQQDQLDLIREEMDHLHDLTELLKNELVQRHPSLKLEDGSPMTIASLLGERRGGDDARGDAGKSTNLEHMHAWLLERMGRIQSTNRSNWQTVKGFLRQEGVDLGD